MKNIKYAFHGLSSRVGITLIILVQVMTSLYYLNSSVVKFIQLKEERKQLLEVYNGKRPFRSYIRREDKKKKIDKDKEKEFREYLLNNDKFKMLVTYEDGIYVKDFNKGEKFLDFLSEMEPKFIPEGYSKVKTIRVSNNFDKIFNLPVTEGRFFTQEDFKGEDCVPIVLGSDYKGLCKIGDEFTISDLNRSRVEVCKVMGFLKENTRCIINTQGSATKKFNDYIIYPIMENIPTENGGKTLYDSSYFLVEGAVFAKDPSKNDEIFLEIQQKCKEKDLWNLVNYSSEKEMEITWELEKMDIDEDLKMFFMIIVFCSIGIITSMLSSIRKRIPEFGVHMLCGAKMGDITIRIILEIGIIIMCAFVAISPISLIKYKNIASVAYLFIFSIVLIILLCIIPVIKLRKLNVNEIVRRNE